MHNKLSKKVLSVAIVSSLFISCVSFAKVGTVFYSALTPDNKPGSMYRIYFDGETDTAHITWGQNGSISGKENQPIPLLSKIDASGYITFTSTDGSTTFTVYDKEVHEFMKAATSDKINSLSRKALLTEQDIRDLYNRVSAIQKMGTNVGLDENGNVAVTPDKINELVSLQSYLAGEAANSTIGIDKNGKLTLNETDIVTPLRINDSVVTVADALVVQKGELEKQKQNLGELTSRTDKINTAAAATDAKVESRTIVGVNSDGTLTRAEGATKIIAVNEGLVNLAGKTERLDATVGAIDNRVSKNTQVIQSNSRQLREHSARLDRQQHQINENYREMKRAAAQSAALTGLFQPYSVGKFNVSAAAGGYGDEQALAVGVGYRFNEQTAAKAGVAFSDGDTSWNVGVNLEF